MGRIYDIDSGDRFYDSIDRKLNTPDHLRVVEEASGHVSKLKPEKPDNGERFSPKAFFEGTAELRKQLEAVEKRWRKACERVYNAKMVVEKAMDNYDIVYGEKLNLSMEEIKKPEHEEEISRLSGIVREKNVAMAEEEHFRDKLQVEIDGLKKRLKYGDVDAYKKIEFK